MRIGNGQRRAARARRELHTLPEQVIEINGAQFVADLYWLNLTSSTRYMAEARSYGAEHKYDIVAIRKGKRIQAGFINQKAGAVKGMYSLAASLVSVLGDSWCGAFRLPDGRCAVVAVHDGMIAPGYDMIGSEAEARAKLEEAINVFRFPVEAIYAPAEFAVSPHSQDIDALLKPKALRKELKLRPLKFGMTRRELGIGAAALALVGASLVGTLAWQHHKEAVAERLQAQREAALRARLAQINANARKQLVLEALAHPWAKQATASDFIGICTTATGSLPLSLAGWTLRDAKCDETLLTATYVRTDGVTVNQFKAAVAHLVNLPVQFDASGEVGTLVIPHVMPAGGDDSLRDFESTSNDFLSHMQALDAGLRPGLTEKPVVIALPPDAPAAAPGEQAPTATWRQIHVSVPSTTLAPDQLFARYGDLSGVRLERITTTLDANKSELTWAIEGNLYAQK